MKIKKEEEEPRRTHLYCVQPPRPAVHSAQPPGALGAVFPLSARYLWNNGATIHYWFLNGTAAQKEQVARAVKVWLDCQIGLRIVPATAVTNAEVRIQFENGGGSWSYLGTDVLNYKTGPTMHFGWNIDNDLDTVVHEWGHTLGMNHEHQNPFSGIVWNEAAVYRELGGPPNNWDRETVFYNVLRKLDRSEVQGSAWDPNSIMHYPFEAGLIEEPRIYRNQRLQPKGGLSELDKTWIQKIYPPKQLESLTPWTMLSARLNPGESVVCNLEIPEDGRYLIQTVGRCEALLTLHDDDLYLGHDDDSGDGKNAKLDRRLKKGNYLVSVRLYQSTASGTLGLVVTH